ncbi:MAG: hypothetical protein R3C44_22185 [Chloroflexota bacterium]
MDTDASPLRIGTGCLVSGRGVEVAGESVTVGILDSGIAGASFRI